MISEHSTRTLPHVHSIQIILQLDKTFLDKKSTCTSESELCEFWIEYDMFERRTWTPHLQCYLNSQSKLKLDCTYNASCPFVCFHGAQILHQSRQVLRGTVERDRATCNELGMHWIKVPIGRTTFQFTEIDSRGCDKIVRRNRN